jgi:antirestriction protein ArdC
VDRLARETLRDYRKERSIRAREELVAELGASYLMADLGLAYTPRPDHAAYLSGGWAPCVTSQGDLQRCRASAGCADWIHGA